jgi:hypothetical protein
MNHQYTVGDLFIYNGNYYDLHGEVGEVKTVNDWDEYSCILLTEKEVPFKRFRLKSYKMLPYKRTPDWEV